MRFAILRMLKFVPDKAMIKLQYRIKLKRKLNLKDPKRYTEKIQWYKLYYRNPVMMECVDKYGVRKYIEKKGLGNIRIRFKKSYILVFHVFFLSFFNPNYVFLFILSFYLFFCTQNVLIYQSENTSNNSSKHILICGK